MLVTLEPEKHVYQTPEGIIVPSYSEIISACEFTDLSDIPEFYLKRSCDKGRGVHKLTELYDKTHDNKKCEEYAKALREWFNSVYQKDVDFLGFLGQWIIACEELKIKKFDYIETAFGSDKHFYATTIDRFGNGIVIDVKTGGKYNTHSLQTMAQKAAMEENGVKVLKRMNVYLKEDSYEIEEHKEDEIDLHNWETCVRFYHLKRKLTKE